MTRTEAARPPFAAVLLTAALLVAATAGAVRACPPEVMFDPVTGQAQGQAEFEAAVADLNRISLAEAGR